MGRRTEPAHAVPTVVSHASLHERAPVQTQPLCTRTAPQPRGPGPRVRWELSSAPRPHESVSQLLCRRAKAGKVRTFAGRTHAPRHTQRPTLRLPLADDQALGSRPQRTPHTSQTPNREGGGASGTAAALGRDVIARRRSSRETWAAGWGDATRRILGFFVLRRRQWDSLRAWRSIPPPSLPRVLSTAA